MENYSNFGLALGSIVVFSATVFIGCVCFWTKKEETLVDDNDIQLSDEITSFKITIDEASSERNLLLNGLDKRFEQLDKCKTHNTFQPDFFKKDHHQQSIANNGRLEKLYSNLMTGINTYPNFIVSEANKKNYIADSHRQFKEHHTDVRVIAELCLKEFDEHLNQLSVTTHESNTLSTI